MRTLIHSSLLIGLIAALVLAGVPALAQTERPTPAHLVASVSNDGDAQVNRMDWDVNAFAVLFPGAGVRPNDYIELTGRTTVTVICTDLSLIEQRGSESPACDPYPSRTVLHYYDDPAWLPPETPPTIRVTSTDPAAIPAEVRDPGAYELAPLGGDQQAALDDATSAILALDTAPDVQAFALAQLYRGQGLYFDAIGALAALPDLGCTERRAFVEIPENGARTLAASPVVYLRLGELFQIIGQPADAARYYQCAAEAGAAYGDPATVALANARSASTAQSVSDAIARYQAAIDNFAALGAADAVETMMALCGQRNCTVPG